MTRKKRDIQPWKSYFQVDLDTLGLPIVISNFDQLLNTYEEIVEIFTFIKDDQANKITSEAFSNLMSELERVKKDCFS